jgi:uncharacterized membrane protein
MYYINYYFIGSLIGYIIETILKTFFIKNMNNGILYGPWIPVYGFGIVLSIIITNYIFNLKISKFKKIFISFIILVIFTTLIEEVGGLLIKFVFKKNFWSYKKLLFNIGPYISIEMSLLWGVLSILFILFIKPGYDLFIKKIPKEITYILLGIHLIDAIFTWLI